MTHGAHAPIVIGVDGSESALDAVRWGAAEAVRRPRPVRLVHVYQVPVGLHGGIIDPGTVRAALREEGRRLLRAARAAVAEVSVDLRPEIVLESAAVVPVLAAQSRSASLLVLGSRGLGGFTGLVIGSTAVLLAGRARCPMVVVRGDGGERRSGPVVVGVDGLETSEAALAFAFDEASLHRTDLVAVHAWHGLVADSVVFRHADPPDYAPAQQRAYEALVEQLAGWQEKYPEVVVRREVVRDHPSAALLRNAADARLVVVGTRGRGGFRGLLLGSTGQHLLHHAPCPVAVVRSGDG